MHLLALLTLLWMSAVSLSQRLTTKDYPKPTFRKTGCRMLINEINTYTENPQTKQFIELSRYCDGRFRVQRAYEMDKFKLLFIAHNGNLVGVCSLKGKLANHIKETFQQVDRKRIKIVRYYWFYTIGRGYANMNMDLSQCDLVPVVYDLHGNDIVRLPIGAQYPVAVALVFNESPEALKSLALARESGWFVPTPITQNMEVVIRLYLQDMYIYGSRTMYQYCDYFTKYFEYGKEVGVLLRDWNVADQKDRSLSRCSGHSVVGRTLPFQPKTFFYANPSPGEVNACASAVDFRIENTQEYRQEPLALQVEPESSCYSFTTDETTSRMHITSDVNYRLQLETLLDSTNADPNPIPVEVTTTPIAESSNPNNCIVEQVNENPVEESQDELGYDVDGADATFQDEPKDQTAFEDSLETDKPYIWPDCDRFTQEKREEIKHIDINPIDLNDVDNKDTCNWFEYMSNVNKYRCSLCHTLLKQQIIFDRPSNIDPIMKTGRMSLHHKNKKFENRKAIRDHAVSIYHNMTLQWYDLYDQGLRGDT